jgi:glutamine amidotransferase
MTERVAIIDYGSGNLRSVEKALQRAVADEGLDCHVGVTSLPEEVLKATRIVLPGVGAFADCMRGVQRIAGLEGALEESVRRRGRPFLGICVGMQLLADEGFEHGRCAGLGWIRGQVVRIETGRAQLKVPHMGWNELKMSRAHPVFSHLVSGSSSHAYFVHSYHFVCANQPDMIATTDHGQTLCAAIGRDNIVGTQFHPEKSQAPGLALLANFIRWRP